MKKVVIIILAILPVVLLITIGIAGQALKYVAPIYVTEVHFVDPVGAVYTSEDIFELGIGEKRQQRAHVQVIPTNANDQEVSFKSNKPEICTVDEQGVLCGIAPGTAIITVTTHDGNKEAKLKVLVKAEVEGITLPTPTLELIKGSYMQLEPTVIHPEAPAEDRRVSYLSSDPSIVTVGANGQLYARELGTAIITLTTADGKYSTTCTVTVIDGIPPLYFDFSEANWITKINGVYESSEAVIDLKTFICSNPESGIDINEVQFVIESGNKATLENGVLTFKAGGPPPIVIKAYATDKDGNIQTTVISIMYS